MHRLLRAWAGLGATSCVLVASACRPEPTAGRDAPQYDVSSLAPEEEFFGEVWENGQRTARTDYSAGLQPFDSATAAHLVGPWSGSVWANPSAPHMYGWYDPVGGGNCGNLADYIAGDSSKRGPEAHWNGPGQPPSGVERHCIRPGIYTFSAAGKGFEVDYLQMAGDNLTVYNSTAGVSERIEATSYSGQQANNWVDFVAHVDLTPGSYQETRVLDVENAGSHPLASTFSNQANPAGTELDFFRFSAARSSPGWGPAGSQGRALSRLYWDFSVNKAIATRYYDGHSTANVIRLHQFKNHVNESRNAVVALELMRPDEAPNDTVNVATRVIAITRTTPVACATFEGTTTWLYTDQVLNAACSSRGANIRYRWRFEAGGGWTGYSPDTLYDYFEGHDTPGAREVTVEALNTTTQASSQHAYPISVGTNQVSLDGRTYVTDKANNLYTSNSWLIWREKFDHDTQWWPATSEPRNRMNRIWYAGVYTVDLRQQDSTPSFLHRGRLHITVCNPPSQCEEPTAPLRAPAASAPGPADWGLFGAGPWLSWGAGNAVRFYDFLGAHDLPSRFTDIGWLDAPDGHAYETGVGSYLSTRRHDLATDDVRGIDFALDTPDAQATITFALALDPDLGPNAADDQAGYDAVRGMVYVFDGDRTVGFLLRDARGRNALQAVTQYGLARRSPLSAADAWTATRARRVSLLRGRSDVQLLLAAPAEAGPVLRTFVIVRGASVADVRARADAVLADLAGSR